MDYRKGHIFAEFGKFVNDLFVYMKKYLYLCRKFDAKEVFMTALQLNADIYRNLAIIAENETMMEKVAKYVRKLANELTNDPACMTKEEYYAKLDRSEAQYERGDYHVLGQNENLTTYLRRRGYEI